MAANLDTLLKDALELTPDERADLAASLLASLGPRERETNAEELSAWIAEVERRALAAESGTTGIPWSDLRDRLRQGLGNGRIDE